MGFFSKYEQELIQHAREGRSTPLPATAAARLAPPRVPQIPRLPGYTHMVRNPRQFMSWPSVLRKAGASRRVFHRLFRQEGRSFQEALWQAQVRTRAFWTPEEKAILRRLHAAGFTPTQISLRITNKSASAVRGRLLWMRKKAAQAKAQKLGHS